MVAQIDSALTYDVGTRQYILPNGEPVSSRQVKQILDAIQGQLGSKLEQITERLLANEITLAQWELATAEAIKDESIVAALLALGGLAALLTLGSRSSYVWTAVGEHVRSQVNGVVRVANTIAKGGRTPAQLRAYARYKAGSVVGAYNRARKSVFIASGFNEARRFLDPTAQHCPDCPAYENPDWAPIADIIPVGHACRCNGRCRCRVQYRFNPERALQSTLLEQLERSKSVENAAQAALSRRLR